MDSNERAIKKMIVQDPTPTPSALATKMIATLDSNTDRDVSVGTLGEAVLDPVQAGDLKAITVELECVRFMTPHFWELFGDAVVVNSEEFPWLLTSGKGQKPDLFVAPKWAYTNKKLGDSVAERGQSDPDFRFGGVYDPRLFDSIYLLDCKLNCNNSALGELIIHLQHLNAKLPPHSTVRGMLFSTSQFMLVKMVGQELIERITGNWTEPGSKACITEFFIRLPWFGVDEICAQFKVEVDELPEDKSTAFLGAGSFGRVLRVHHVDNVTEKLALKVSLIENVHRLAAEHELLRTHARGCTCTLLVRPELEVFKTSHLCGFMMSPVGTGSLQRNTLTDENLQLAVNALLSLHSHDPVVIHGDARLANLIILEEGGLSWVDLTGGSRCSSANKSFGIKHDIDTFIGSVLGGFDSDSPRYDDLQKCSTNCSTASGDADYSALYDVLVAAKRLA